MSYPTVTISCGKCGKSWYAKENCMFAPSCLCDDVRESEVALATDPKPFTCPVCSGKGQVISNLYENFGGWSWVAITTEPCKSCEGTGIVWRD